MNNLIYNMYVGSYNIYTDNTDIKVLTLVEIMYIFGVIYFCL